MRHRPVGRLARWTGLVSGTAVVAALLASVTTMATAAEPNPRIGPRLRYLRHRVATGSMAAPDRVAVSLLLSASTRGRVLTAAELGPGVMLHRGADGRVLRTVSVVPVLTSLERVERLASLPGVELVETDWFPRRPPPPLDLSRPEIGVPAVWPELDPVGRPLTGQGVVIGNLDSGIDVFHPAFFKPDGGSYEWIDVDSSGDLTPGVDAVDLDGDLVADPEETLRVLETGFSASYPTANPPGYDIDIDWLYADSDDDRQRDFGRGAGFDDATPGFGEPLLFVDDLDRDGQVDVGESLIRLGTSKIRVVRERAGIIRRRGVDLIDTEPDTYAPHGTWVAGILLGGIAGVSRMAGQAPDAELVLADLYYQSMPPFQEDLAVLALWAVSEGAHLVQYEEGSWPWSWLDGSHPNEVAVSELADAGTPQLIAAGNLSGGGQQQARMFAAGASDVMAATTPSGQGVTVVWPSLLWRGDPADATVVLTLPGSTTLTPCLCATTEIAGGFAVYSDASVSPRGTTMLNFEIRADGGGPIAGIWSFELTTIRDLEVVAYSWDDRSGWSGITRWNMADDVHTVTRPATADGAIVIGAHSPRNCSGCTPPGALNGFSGRGERIDGVPLVDVTAPGSRVYSSGTHNGSLGLGNYSAFGGTSSALPHATGAAALLAQLNPNDPHAVIERILRETALVDGFTGPVPNTAWGMGKLRLRPAYQIAARPSLLRNDAVSTLRPLTPDKPFLFPDSGPTTLRLAGANGFSRELEGGPLSDLGSADGDAFLLAHVESGVGDPEGPSVVSDTARPLVLYQLTGPVVLKLTQDGAGVTVWFE